MDSPAETTETAKLRAEIERLQLELHGALYQVEKMSGIGAELVAVRSSRSFQFAQTLQRLAMISRRMLSRRR